MIRCIVDCVDVSSFVMHIATTNNNEPVWVKFTYVYMRYTQHTHTHHLLAAYLLGWNKFCVNVYMNCCQRSKNFYRLCKLITKMNSKSGKSIKQQIYCCCSLSLFLSIRVVIAFSNGCIRMRQHIFVVDSRVGRIEMHENAMMLII